MEVLESDDIILPLLVGQFLAAGNNNAQGYCSRMHRQPVRHIIPFLIRMTSAEQSSAVLAPAILEFFYSQAIRRVFSGQVTISWTHP
jgi:hypothetical protein